MRTFDYSTLKNCTIDTQIINLIAKIREYKGKQTLYIHQKKERTV